jgi:hypothetical protein
MSLDITDPAHLGAVVAFAGRVGSLDDLSSKLRYLDTHRGRAKSRCVLSPSTEHHAIDVVMFERRRSRWAPVFTGRIAPSRSNGNATFTLAVEQTARR